MAVYEIAIDLGSNFTTIYKRNGGIVLREPSLVLLETNTKNIKVDKIGIEAQKMVGKISQDRVFVRPIVEGVIKNLELTQKMVTYFINKVVRYNLIKPSIKIIVCLPTCLNETQYEDYKRVFYAIGFAKINFVYGAVCASLVESPNASLGKAYLLVDIGAGKSEICLIVNHKIINACSVNIGGNLIDQSIISHLQKTKNYHISQNIANKIKKEIGSLYETDKSVMEVFVHTNLNTSVPQIVSAQDILKPVYENYFKILQALQAFLNQCSLEITQDIKNEGIIVFGGGSQITGLEKFFKTILNQSVFVVDNPETFKVSGCEKLFGDIQLLQKVIDDN